MKQLCYLSEQSRAGRWDELCARLDIVVTWYDIDRIKSLSAFVAREKTLYQQDYILLDLAQHTWSNEHILSAVQMLRRFFVGQLLFLSPEHTDAKQLFGALANQFHVSGLFFDGEDAEERVQSFLEAPREGRLAAMLGAVRDGVAAQAGKTVSPLNIPRGLTLTVAVAGAMPRCGVTTQTIALFHYLASLGFAPAILDASDRAEPLLEFYSETCRRKDGYAELGGVLFCQEPQERFNAYIVDTGTVRSDGVLFRDADLVVVVGGAKPWELPPLAAALAFLRDVKREDQIAALISFSTPRELKQLEPYLGKHFAPCSYHPDLLAPSAPAPYQKAILPCLKALCGDGA